MNPLASIKVRIAFMCYYWLNSVPLKIIVTLQAPGPLNVTLFRKWPVLKSFGDHDVVILCYGGPLM